MDSTGAQTTTMTTTTTTIMNHEQVAQDNKDIAGRITEESARMRNIVKIIRGIGGLEGLTDAVKEATTAGQETSTDKRDSKNHVKEDAVIEIPVALLTRLQ
jgi:hypothetical protein